MATWKASKFAAILFLTFFIIATIVVIQQYTTNHFEGEKCSWTQSKTTELRHLRTPPWFALLANYKTTVSSGKNLYVWPTFVPGYRLGNILFNYAATFGIAWHNNRIPIWPKKEISALYNIASFFNLRIPVAANGAIINNRDTDVISISAKGSGIYDTKFEHLPDQNVTIKSVFASYKYFRNVEQELRIDFTFRRNILRNACRWLEKQTPYEWKDKKFVRVVIHVRRTDYLKKHYQRDGWPRPTDQYFNESMLYFTKSCARVQFVVLSDDPVWCTKHLHVTSNNSIVFSSGNSPIEDLAIASLCDHAIITIGTFGWWAAWFANGVTITQRNLPRVNSALSRRLYRNDHYKTNWIGL